MTDETKALLSQVRRYLNDQWAVIPLSIHNFLVKLCAALEASEARADANLAIVNRLEKRESLLNHTLRGYVDGCEQCNGVGYYYTSFLVTGKPVKATCPTCQPARRALKMEVTL